MSGARPSIGETKEVSFHEVDRLRLAVSLTSCCVSSSGFPRKEIEHAVNRCTECSYFRMSQRQSQPYNPLLELKASLEF
jgi:hypothetical protein